MALGFREFLLGIKFQPTTVVLAGEGQTKYDSALKTIVFYDGVAERAVVVSTGNTITGAAGSTFTISSANNEDLNLTAPGTGEVLVEGQAIQTAITVSDTATIDLTFAANDISGIIVPDSITDTQINSAAAISRTKLEALTPNRALVTDASGFDTVSVTTDTEISYVNGVTSSIQTQINGKEDSFTILPTTKGGTGVNGTAIFPTTGTVVTEAGVEVLTNKDIDGGTASNTSRITLPKETKANLDALTRKQATIVYGTDTQKAYLDTGTILVPVGSSSNNVVVNYITNPDAEVDTAGWSTYADGTAIPVDGQGGSPTLTFTRSTSSPLRGLANFLVTPGALGNGAAFKFTLDRADLGFIQSLSFNYEIDTPGSFTDGDIKLYVISAADAGYTTNLVVTELSTANLPKAIGSAAYLGFYQAHPTNIYYSVLVHQVTAASGYSVKLDSVFFGKQQASTAAAIITEWQDYPMVVTSTGTSPTLGTTSTNKAQYRRVGSDLEVRYDLVITSAGTTGTGDYLYSLPAGLTIDTTKAQSIQAIPSLKTGRAGVGTLGFSSGNTSAVIEPVAYNSTKFILLIPDNTTSNYFQGAGGFSFGNANLTHMSFVAKFPILGWSANGVASIADGQSPVSVFVNRITSGQNIPGATYTKVLFNNVKKDTSGGFDTVLSRFTAKVAGDYNFSLGLNIVDIAATAGQGFIMLYKNGTNIQHDGIFNYASGGETSSTPSIKAFNVVAGDYFEIFIYSSSAINIYGDNAITGGSFMSIDRINMPSSFIAPTETVAARYKNSGSAASQTNNGAYQDFPSALLTLKDYDSFGSFNSSTNEFTCGVSGLYNTVGQIAFNSSATGVRGILLLVNTGGGYVNYSENVLQASSASSTVISLPSTDIQLKPGDKLKFQGYQNSGGNLAYDVSGTPGQKIFVQFRKVG